MKKIIIFAVIILFVTATIIVNVMVSDLHIFLMEPETVHVSSVRIDDSSLALRGFFVLESMKVYKKYTYDIQDNVVYIKVYCGSRTKKNEYGEFDFIIYDDFSDVKEVVLIGKENSLILYQMD